MLDILTFGCRLNTLESEVMRASAAEAGLADAVLVNTCAVTAEAVRQARQAIRKAKRERPDRPVVVTGCAAHTDRAAFAAMPEVDRILGNAEKLTAEAFRKGAAAERVRVADIMALRETAGHFVDGIEGRTRAFAQVQNGCDHRCTFCVIPYGRGPSRSVPADAAVAQVRRLVERGAREVVLTGVDMTAWGLDLASTPRLGTLVRAILAGVPELRRLRLSSIDSVEADPDLLDAIASEERLMPHLHLSFQHGDDLILKRMRRRHSRADAIRFADTVRRLRPGIALGADIIAGFPTEDEAMFAGTLSMIEECAIAFVHAFPFSPRAGTPAARMPQLDRGLVRERAARLREAGEAALDRHLAGEVGHVHRVLVERRGFGRTETFTGIDIGFGSPGEIVTAAATGRTAGRLVAGAHAEVA